MSDAHVVAIAIKCTRCDWETFPMTAEEGASFGWVGFSDTDGALLAQLAGQVHVALRHPATFTASTGRNVEEALADYAATLGPLLFEVVRRLALLETSEWWDRPT